MELLFICLFFEMLQILSFVAVGERIIFRFLWNWRLSQDFQVLTTLMRKIVGILTSMFSSQIPLSSSSSFLLLIRRSFFLFLSIRIFQFVTILRVMTISGVVKTSPWIKNI